MIKIGSKVKVVINAKVSQDFGILIWTDAEIIFNVDDKFPSNRYKLKAPGYGDLKNYGNGCIYVDKSDLIEINDSIPNKIQTIDTKKLKILYAVDGLYIMYDDKEKLYSFDNSTHLVDFVSDMNKLLNGQLEIFE